MKKMILIFSLLIVLQSCRLGPKYNPPTLYAPENWKAPHTQQMQTSCIGYWWELFDDPTLNQLEWQAIENNPNLGIALQRVVEARAQVEISAANLYPQLTLNPLYTNTGQLFKIFFPQGLIPATTAIPDVFRIHQLQYFLPVNISYEIDLWGRLRDQLDSAYFTYQASIYDLQAILLTLTTDLASNYFQMRGFDRQIDILARTVETRKKELHLADIRYTKGITTRQDFTNAEVNLANAENSLLDAQRMRVITENAIAALIGIPATIFCTHHNPLEMPPPEIPAGIPSDVLLQRPDIAEAERKAASEHALIGAAYASFFPSLTLSGVLGSSSPDLKHFLTWKSRFWQIAGASNQTIFDGGTLEGNYLAAWARFGQASWAYQQTVITAFREVEDSLNNLDYQAKEYRILVKGVSAAQETARLSLQRYLQGAVNYLEVTVNDRTLLDIQINAANTLTQRYVSTVQLIKALGGGWQFPSVCQD